MRASFLPLARHQVPYREWLPTAEHEADGSVASSGGKSRLRYGLTSFRKLGRFGNCLSPLRRFDIAFLTALPIMDPPLEWIFRDFRLETSNTPINEQGRNIWNGSFKGAH